MKSGFKKNIIDLHINSPNILPSSAICEFTNEILGLLFPEFSTVRFENLSQLDHQIGLLKQKLKDILLAIQLVKKDLVIEETVEIFFEKLELIYKDLKTDIEAILGGDPAAQSETEIIRAYPGFYAIAFYRIAHQLHLLQIPIVPRIITSFAHNKTGIDIHPGAIIGQYFCIDHGTGVVIGETTIIGKYVKLYQGVTLGALSVDKSMASQKRHPTIEDHVVIYAGATILGGETQIGNHSVIGGNAWLTRGVPPYSVVYNKPQIEVRTAEQRTDIPS
ncbi:MAG: serine acetyltransferase [Cytophagales bacterium]|nr:MAG: serine acetyltransferase [Cytophagales bacterium]